MCHSCPLAKLAFLYLHKIKLTCPKDPSFTRLGKGSAACGEISGVTALLMEMMLVSWCQAHYFISLTQLCKAEPLDDSVRNKWPEADRKYDSLTIALISLLIRHHCKKMKCFGLIGKL